MTPAEVYELYIATKLHFSSDYDFNKYHGRVKFKRGTFDARNDRYYFQKLSKHHYPKELLAITMFDNPQTWIGNIFDEKYEKALRKFLKFEQGATYQIGIEMSQYKSFADAFDGAKLLADYKAGKVSPQTLIICNDIFKIFDYWDKKIDDPFIWPSIKKNLLNLKAFVSYDSTKIRQKLFNMFD